MGAGDKASKKVVTAARPRKASASSTGEKSTENDEVDQANEAQDAGDKIKDAFKS